MTITKTIPDLKKEIIEKQNEFATLASEINKLEDQANTIRASRDKFGETLLKKSSTHEAKARAEKSYDNKTKLLERNESIKKLKTEARGKITSEISAIEYSISVIEALEFVEEMKALTSIKDTAKLREAFRTKLQPQHTTNNNPHQ